MELANSNRSEHELNATLKVIFAVTILLALLVLLAGVAGVGFYLVQRRRASHPRPGAPRHLPRQWPLNPRPLANSAERRAWLWLQQVFPEHIIMLKLPVTRFTTPHERGAANEWFHVLSSTYCTYTVCDAEGTVIGCADLPGARGLSQDNRQLKQTLLAQCGIGYWELDPQAMPSAEELRAEFLGAHAGDGSLAYLVTGPRRLQKVASNLHEMLHNKRSHRLDSASPAPEADVDSAGGQNSGSSNPPWTQQDSFLAALDSRRAALNGKG